MKILKYRFRLPAAGNKQQATTASATSPITSPGGLSEGRSTPAPVVKKFKKKALLIGVQKVREEGNGISSPVSAKFPASAAPKNLKAKWDRKKQTKLSALRGPHRDVRAMRDLLINVYKYAPEDIVMLIDDEDANQKQPTKAHILEELTNLVKDAEENDRFFFHFAGHSDQEDTDDIAEEDRKNEFILTSDGGKIQDDVLRSMLAEPLPAKSSLIAVFDSCHSGSLLDLDHFRCNRVYVPWMNKGHRKTNSLWNANKRMQANISVRGGPIARLNRHSFKWAKTSIDNVLQSPKDSLPHAAQLPQAGAKLSIVTDVAKPLPTWLDSPNKTQCSSPVALYCTGFCREHNSLSHGAALKADVISISSAQDSQMSWEDPSGMSMTQSIVRILNETHHPTFQELMTSISHDIHDYYVDLHSRAREYRKLVQRINSAKIKMGKKPREGDKVEMNNFQDPQLSSDRPLDMSRHFYP